MIRNLLVLTVVIVFAACTARVIPPKVEIDSPHVQSGGNHASQGKFCPPGQAKKGRC